METKQLRYFVAIANEKQITKAAKKLFITQPSLSRQLQALEEELGTCLIFRSNKAMELTEAGELFLVQAQEILAQIDDLPTTTKINPQETGGILNIGTLISCTDAMAKYLKTFHQSYPNVTFKIWEDAPYVLLDLLKKHEIEMAFLRTPTFDPTGFCVHILERGEFYFAISQDQDPCPEKTEITIAELVKIPLILLHESKLIGYNELIMNEFRQKKLHPQMVCQCSNSSIALVLTGQGMGGTILPQMFIKQVDDTSITYKRISDFSCDTNPTVVWDNQHYLSNRAKALLELMGADINQVAL